MRNVKESNQLKEDASTNGPQGTVSKKTQTSIELLLKGMTNLMINLEKNKCRLQVQRDFQNIVNHSSRKSACSVTL